MTGRVSEAGAVGAGEEGGESRVREPTDAGDESGETARTVELDSSGVYLGMTLEAFGVRVSQSSQPSLDANGAASDHSGVRASPKASLPPPPPAPPISTRADREK